MTINYILLLMSFYNHYGNCFPDLPMWLLYGDYQPRSSTLHQQRWVFAFLLMGAMAAMGQTPYQPKQNFGRLPQQQQLQQVGPKCALVVPKGRG